MFFLSSARKVKIYQVYIKHVYFKMLLFLLLLVAAHAEQCSLTSSIDVALGKKDAYYTDAKNSVFKHGGLYRTSIVEVTSGTPDMSVSEAECQAYAAQVGIPYSVQNGESSAPTGCYQFASALIKYNNPPSSQPCSSTYNCIQKATMVKSGLYRTSIVEVTSGTPVPITEAECAAYYSSVGYTFGYSAVYNTAYRPRGCFLNADKTQLHYNSYMSSVPCGVTSDWTDICIQKAPTMVKSVSTGEYDTCTIDTLNNMVCDNYVPIYRKTTGSPDPSHALTEAECQAYVQANGLNWGTQLSSSNHPTGCFLNSNNYHYYNTRTTSDVADCISTFSLACIEKGPKNVQDVSIGGKALCYIQKGTIFCHAAEKLERVDITSTTGTTGDPTWTLAECIEYGGDDYFLPYANGVYDPSTPAGCYKQLGGGGAQNKYIYNRHPTGSAACGINYECHMKVKFDSITVTDHNQAFAISNGDVYAWNLVEYNIVQVTSEAPDMSVSEAECQAYAAQVGIPYDSSSPASYGNGSPAGCMRCGSNICFSTTASPKVCDANYYCLQKAPSGFTDNSLGQLGLNDKVLHESPQKINLHSVTKVAANNLGGCAITPTGLSCWGYGLYPLVYNTGPFLYPTEILTLAGIRDVALKDDTVCIVTSANHVECWGVGFVTVTSEAPDMSVSEAECQAYAGDDWLGRVNTGSYGTGSYAAGCFKQLSAGGGQNKYMYNINLGGACSSNFACIQKSNITERKDMGLTNIVKIFSSRDRTCSVKDSGDIQCWGQDPGEVVCPSGYFTDGSSCLQCGVGEYYELYAQVTSGAPDLSVSEAECQAYAASVGAGGGGSNQNFVSNRPSGCFFDISNLVYYNIAVNTYPCDSTYNCIQKNQCLPCPANTYQSSTGHMETSCTGCYFHTQTGDGDPTLTSSECQAFAGDDWFGTTTGGPVGCFKQLVAGGAQNKYMYNTHPTGTACNVNFECVVKGEISNNVCTACPSGQANYGNGCELIPVSWSCTAASPESTGTFEVSSDCTMTSAGVTLSGDLTLYGADDTLKTITAKTSGDRRHFTVDSGLTLTLRWLKLTGGNMQGGAIEYGSETRSGGSIYVDGTGSTLHATHCTFHNSIATYGGAIYGRLARFYLYHSTITECEASGGGGVSNWNSDAYIEDSTISQNKANYGGGIHQIGNQLNFVRSLISQNAQMFWTGLSNGGGGIYLKQNVMLYIGESTVDRNTAQSNNGKQIFVNKLYSWGIPRVIIRNTKFVSSGGGEDFWFYDSDSKTASPTIERTRAQCPCFSYTSQCYSDYGYLANQNQYLWTSFRPCAFGGAPFTGYHSLGHPNHPCTNRDDNKDYGITCDVGICPAGQSLVDDFQGQLSLLPPEGCTETVQEWSCTSADPQTRTTYKISSDCTMTRAGGVTVTGDLTLYGADDIMRTITASANSPHFTVNSGYHESVFTILTLRYLKLTGGASSVHVSEHNALHASFCVFFANTGPSAVIRNDAGAIELYHSEIVENTINGIFNNGGSILIEDSIIAENTGEYAGGGIKQVGGTFNIVRSQIRNNRLTLGNGYDGGGGMMIESNAVGTIRESIFEGNEADTNNGHHILMKKPSALTVVNTKFDRAQSGTDFYLYDSDTPSNSGAEAYLTSLKTCADANPCTVAPFTGSCRDAYGQMLCDHMDGCFEGSYARVYAADGVQKEKCINNFYEQAAGTPDLSVTEAQCQAYAAANGLNYGQTHTVTDRVRGCYIDASSWVSFNEDTTNSHDCGTISRPCIQRNFHYELKDTYTLDTVKQHVNSDTCTCFSSRDCRPDRVCRNNVCACPLGLTGPECSLVDNTCKVRTFDKEVLILDFYEKTSGTPDLSVSEAECQAYAVSKSRPFASISETGNPSGCFHQLPTNLFYYNTRDVSVQCGIVHSGIYKSTCIQQNKKTLGPNSLLSPTETKISFVTSGMPDLSVSEAECQAYAAENGFTWNGHTNGYFGASYPRGCVKYGSAVRYNRDLTTGPCSYAGGGTLKCIQKTPCTLGKIEYSQVGTDLTLDECRDYALEMGLEFEGSGGSCQLDGSKVTYLQDELIYWLSIPLSGFYYNIWETEAGVSQHTNTIATEVDAVTFSAPELTSTNGGATPFYRSQSSTDSLQVFDLTLTVLQTEVFYFMFHVWTAFRDSYGGYIHAAATIDEKTYIFAHSVGSTYKVSRTPGLKWEKSTSHRIRVYIYADMYINAYGQSGFNFLWTTSKHAGATSVSSNYKGYYTENVDGVTGWDDRWYTSIYFSITSGCKTSTCIDVRKSYSSTPVTIEERNIDNPITEYKKLKNTTLYGYEDRVSGASIQEYLQVITLAPDMSVSEAECQAYAGSIDAVWGGAGAFTGYPSGCVNMGNVLYNNDATADGCSTSKMCIQKNPEAHRGVSEAECSVLSGYMGANNGQPPEAYTPGGYECGAGVVYKIAENYYYSPTYSRNLSKASNGWNCYNSGTGGLYSIVQIRFPPSGCYRLANGSHAYNRKAVDIACGNEYTCIVKSKGCCSDMSQLACYMCANDKTVEQACAAGVQKTSGSPDPSLALTEAECLAYVQANGLNWGMAMVFDHRYPKGCFLNSNNYHYYNTRTTSDVADCMSTFSLACIEKFPECALKTCDGGPLSRKHIDKCGVCGGVDSCDDPLDTAERNLLNDLPRGSATDETVTHDIMTKPSTTKKKINLLKGLFHMLWDDSVSDENKRLKVDLSKDYTTSYKRSILEGKGESTIDLITLTGTSKESPKLFASYSGLIEVTWGANDMSVSEAECAKYATSLALGYAMHNAGTEPKGCYHRYYSGDNSIRYNPCSWLACPGCSGTFPCVKKALADDIETFEAVTLVDEAISFHRYGGPLVEQGSTGLTVYELDSTGQDKVNIVYNNRLLSASVSNTGTDLTLEECQSYAIKVGRYFAGSGNLQPDPEPYAVGCSTSYTAVKFQTVNHFFNCGDDCHETVSSGAPLYNMNAAECQAYAQGWWVAAGSWNYAKGCIKSGNSIYFNTMDNTLHCGTYGVTCIQKKACDYACVKNPVTHTPQYDIFSTGGKDITITMEICETYALENGLTFSAPAAQTSGCTYDGQMKWNAAVTPCTGSPCLRKNDKYYLAGTLSLKMTGFPDYSVTQAECQAFANSNGHTWGGVVDWGDAGGCIHYTHGGGIDIHYNTYVAQSPMSCAVSARKCLAKSKGDTSDNALTPEECETYANVNGHSYETGDYGSAVTAYGCVDLTGVGASVRYQTVDHGNDCTGQWPCVKRESTAIAPTTVAIDGSHSWKKTVQGIVQVSTGMINDLSVSQAECQAYASANGYSFTSNAYSGAPRGCHAHGVSVFWNTQDQNTECGSWDIHCIQYGVTGIKRHTVVSGSMLTYSEDVALVGCTGTPCVCDPEYYQVGLQCVRDTITSCAAGYTLVFSDHLTDDSACVDIDECLSSPCPNGVCTNTPGSYSCACEAGWGGTNCETDIDDCALTPCYNGGVCTDALNAVVCDCTGTGYQGYRCDNDANDCLVNRCLNGGTCVDETGGFTCQCPTGLLQPLCDDKCNPSPCINGDCTNVVGGYSCTCQTGWEGTNCENSINDCIGISCTNGAVCIDQHVSYECMCAPGWEGILCENEIDECNIVSCMNGGTCVDQLNAFTCNCLKGYGGTYCEQNMCNPNPCARGTCVGLSGDYECWCPSGWTGKQCQENVDECLANPCQHGTCTDQIADYRCDCLVGYDGKNCDNDIDDCSPNPCQNGGVCTDMVNGYSCACASGFSGVICATDNNECSSAPCQNGGVCNNLPGGFECACPPGWGSKTCDVEIDECQATPCKHNGACTDLFNDFECNCTGTNHTGKDCAECPVDFEGPNCEQPIDYCSPMPCRHGTCSSVSGGYVCNCTDGFIGKNCDSGLSTLNIISIYVSVAVVISIVVVFFLFYCGVLKCGEEKEVKIPYKLTGQRLMF